MVDGGKIQQILLCRRHKKVVFCTHGSIYIMSTEQTQHQLFKTYSGDQIEKICFSEHDSSSTCLHSGTIYVQKV